MGKWESGETLGGVGGGGSRTYFMKKYVFNKRKYINGCMGNRSIESHPTLGERGGKEKAVGER